MNFFLKIGMFFYIQLTQNSNFLSLNSFWYFIKYWATSTEIYLHNLSFNIKFRFCGWEINTLNQGYQYVKYIFTNFLSNFGEFI